jgi:plastocyanin
MTSKRNKTCIVGGNILAFVILTVPFLGISPSETLAQGTNETNATAASEEEGQVTVVMPAGSATATTGGGYEPEPVTVSPGSTIIWDNQDNALHTATSGNPETGPDGTFDTGLVAANEQSEPIPMPTEPGEYAYFCTLHPFLVGTVIVQ